MDRSCFLPRLLTTIMVTLFTFPLFLHADDEENNPVPINGRTLYTAKLCPTCHGPHGQEPIGPLYPKLAGQNRAYALQQFQDIQSGKRNNALSPAMKPMIANISESEANALFDYLSAIPLRINIEKNSQNNLINRKTDAPKVISEPTSPSGSP
ncbi:c-type cytochrome [Magnetococcales bacterium HHB-1]